MFQFTAAHRTLPLGTIVKVTNLRNGKWVIVKVNDRGPYVGHRLVDLSYGAAQMLAFRQRGIEKVKLEVIEPETLAMNVSTD
jgi:rare lipoprotein A